MAAGKQQQQQGWVRRNQAWIAGACVAAAASYVAYRAYHSKSLASTQATLLRAAETLQRLGAAAGAAGAALEQVAGDLQDFLDSDSDEVPRSLRQLAKLARCPEVQDTISACVGAAARGAAPQLTSAALATIDRLLEAVMSERGTNVVALAVSVAAREGTSTLVASLRDAVVAALAPTAAGAAAGEAVAQWQQLGHEQWPRRGAGPQAAAPGTQRAPPQQHQSAPPAGVEPSLGDAASAAILGALALLQSPRGERLMHSVISSGVGSAVGAALDQATAVDVYGPMISAFSRPELRPALTELAAAMSGACCREMWAAVGSWPAAGASGGGGVSGAVVVEVASASGTDEAGASAPLLHSRSRSSSASSLEGDGGSGPSTPPSGPTTPEPSLLGAGLVRRQPQSPQTLRRRRGAAAAASAGPAALLQHRFAAAAVAGGNTGASGVAAAAPAGAGGAGAWVVAVFAHASRSPEVRSLILDMSRSSTREFVRTLVPAFWGGWGWPAAGAGAGGVAAAVAELRLRVARLQALLVVAMLVVLHALCPCVVAALPATGAP